MSSVLLPLAQNGVGDSIAQPDYDVLTQWEKTLAVDIDTKHASGPAPIAECKHEQHTYSHTETHKKST